MFVLCGVVTSDALLWHCCPDDEALLMHCYPDEVRKSVVQSGPSLVAWLPFLDQHVRL